MKTEMFTEALIAKYWNSNTDKWLNKQWYIPAMENYLTTKRNELLMHKTMQTNLKIIMLTERSQIRVRNSIYIKFKNAN